MVCEVYLLLLISVELELSSFVCLVAAENTTSIDSTSYSTGDKYFVPGQIFV